MNNLVKFDTTYMYMFTDILIFCSSYQTLSAGNYSINASSEINRDSPSVTPTRPHRLGYGAVMTADRNLSYSVSPITQSPSHIIIS